MRTCRNLYLTNFSIILVSQVRKLNYITTLHNIKKEDRIKNPVFFIFIMSHQVKITLRELP